MKRLFTKKWCICILSIFMCFSYLSMKACAFSGKTHQYTTQRGIEILDSVLGEKYKEFYLDKDREQILKYCTKPDEDETDGAFKYHFYNPATEKNFMGEDDSALARCKNHYQNAINLFNNDCRENAFEELGRSLHFLEDLNTPVHTNNQSFVDTTYNVSFHVSFENKCKDIQSRVVSSLLKKEFRYYRINTIENIAKACAFLANDNFYSLYKKTLPREAVAANSIKNAQKSVAGVLYKFYLDVN